jgi:hypothetical protein
MAVFALLAKDGPAYSPGPCGIFPVRFSDVPAGSPFCPWVEELARRGVVSGCAPGRFCPADPVPRDQMAVFMLATLDQALDPPDCQAPTRFSDVPAGSVFCRWVEELARRGVVAGCAPGLYCPGQPVLRQEMAVFLTSTFGLSLYGP